MMFINVNIVTKHSALFGLAHFRIDIKSLFFIFRLDFENFVLNQPDTVDHVCLGDKFLVSGGPPIPAICGTNSGQHRKLIYF